MTGIEPTIITSFIGLKKEDRGLYLLLQTIAKSCCYRLLAN